MANTKWSLGRNEEPDTGSTGDAAPTIDPATLPALNGLASEPAQDADTVFSRSKPNPYRADVETAIRTHETRRIPARGDDDVKRIMNAVRKAARELHVSLNVKPADGFVYFRVKDAA